MAKQSYRVIYEGGPDSGNFGHSGRPGEVGGSGPGGGGDIGGGFSFSSYSPTMSGYKVELKDKDGKVVEITRTKGIARGSGTMTRINGPNGEKSFSHSGPGQVSEKIGKYLQKTYGIDFKQVEKEIYSKK